MFVVGNRSGLSEIAVLNSLFFVLESYPFPTMTNEKFQSSSYYASKCEFAIIQGDYIQGYMSMRLHSKLI